MSRAVLTVHFEIDVESDIHLDEADLKLLIPIEEDLLNIGHETRTGLGSRLRRLKMSYQGMNFDSDDGEGNLYDTRPIEEV